MSVDSRPGEGEATIDDKAMIGSITRTFTSTAILQQVAAGALALDDTARRGPASVRSQSSYGSCSR